jgi:hypothetical protein
MQRFLLSRLDRMRNAMKALLAALAWSFAIGPIGALASRPPPAVPVVPDAAPAVSYDPVLIARIGTTYARYHFDFSHAFAHVPGAPAPVATTPADRRRLTLHFSNAVDDAARDRIIATLAAGDGARTNELEKLFANDDFLDHATEAIRVFGLHETDLADVTSAFVIAGYNASHPIALSAVQAYGLASDIRAALLAAPQLPAIDEATKQTIATEMSYQLLLWEFDASLFGSGQNPAAFARLHDSIATSFATVGIALAALRPTDGGVEIAAPAPVPARPKTSVR